MRGASVPSDTTPAHIVVEGLDIRGARPPFTYRTETGATASYIANAAALYVAKGTNLVIRGCELLGQPRRFFEAAALFQETINVQKAGTGQDSLVTHMAETSDQITQ